MLDLVVVGLGYVGLPLAHEASLRGLNVTGLDVQRGAVDGLNRGRSHIDDLSDDQVADMLRCGFRATTDAEVIKKADVVVVCVPTPLSDERAPDLRAVTAAGETIAQWLQPGTLVILESTTYPGTTEEYFKPLLEAHGLRAGSDFNLAFSPERIDPGNKQFGIRNTPKVVGGFTGACTERAADFYGRFIDTVVKASGTREAEMAKLLENTYRHINIALVNEMARFCNELDIDLWNVIDCAATKPFGFQVFRPGPGVGGHCIPIDPNYLSYQVKTKLGYPFRFVELAEEINSSMPLYVARRVQDELNKQGKALKGAKVLLVGVTYKRDIADERESPAVPLAEQLVEWGADVVFHDPHVGTWVVAGVELRCVEDLERELETADIAVLLQDHSVYDLPRLADRATLLFDTRGAVRRPGVAQL